MAEVNAAQTAGSTSTGTTGDGAGNNDAYKGLQRDLNAKDAELKAIKAELETARAGSADKAALETELAGAKADKLKLETALKYKDVDLNFFFEKGLSPDKVDDEFVDKIRTLSKKDEDETVQPHNPQRAGGTVQSDAKKLLASLPSLLMES